MAHVSDLGSYQSATQRMQDSMDSERAEKRAGPGASPQKGTQKIQSSQELAKVESERASARNDVKRLKEELYGQKGKSSVHEASSENAIDRALAAQKKSDSQEISQLEDELSVYRNSDRDLESTKAKAKQEAIEETEGQGVQERNRIIEGYERQIAKMKEHEVEMQDHFNRRLAETMLESGARTRSELHSQKEEFLHDAQDQNRKLTFEETNFKNELDHERARQANASVNLVNKNDADLQKAIANQSQVYQNYISNQGERNQQEVSTRDQKIRELQTTNDPLKVSPFVVGRIQDATEKRYYAELTEANQVNEKNLKAEQERDQLDRRELSDRYQTKFTQATRGAQKEVDLKEGSFLKSYEDLSNRREDDLAYLKDQHRSQFERTSQRQALTVSQMQKQKTQALEEQHDTLLYEKSAALDDADQSRRNHEREWFLKTNDLRRNLETKMAEQRDEHEKRVSEIKLEYDKKLRDQDRVSKRTLDERVRGYEHQIQQQDLAFKEKERFLTEHYEEELDRMRRTNAHLIQKKS